MVFIQTSTLFGIIICGCILTFIVLKEMILEVKVLKELNKTVDDPCCDDDKNEQ